MKTSSVLLILMFISINVFSQNYDYTFCIGKIKLLLKADGTATQSLMNSNGGIQSIVSGNYDKYNEGSPTEIIKINFKGTEYRYDLIKNGQGVPSMIIDAQGRKYPLCKYEKAKEVDYLDEMNKEIAEKESMQKRMLPKTNAFIQEVKKIDLLFKDPKKRSTIPLLYSNLERANPYIRDYLTSSQWSWLSSFFDKVKLVEKENVAKMGDKYGILEDWNLMNYISMNNIKNYLPRPDSCNFKYEIKRSGKTYTDKIITTGTEDDKGYTLNGVLYDKNEKNVATITQDDSYYILKLNYPKRDYYKNNIDLIKIRKSGGGIDSNMEIEYGSSSNEYMISEIYRQYGGEAESQKYKIQYVVKSVNRGCPLVGALHLLSRDLR